MLLARLKSRLEQGERSWTLNEFLRQARVKWHGAKLDQPDWSDESHSLAATASVIDGQVLMHIMTNAYWEPLAFELPREAGTHQEWRRLIDTYLESPEDISDVFDAPVFSGESYVVEARSVVILFALRAG